MDYGCIIYDNISMNLVSRLENIYRAAQIVTGAYHHTDTRTLLNEFSLCTLQERRSYFKLCFYHKLLNGLLPTYLNSVIPNLVSDTSMQS